MSEVTSKEQRLTAIRREFACGNTAAVEIERLQRQLARAAHEPPAILPLPPPAEWFLVGEVRRSWPDGQQMVRLEDYEALRQHIELARAAPCPQCIHGDGAHEETCPLRPAQPPGADRELLFDLWLEINSTDNAPLIPYGLRESIAMQRLRNVVGQYLKTTRPTKISEQP